MLPKLLLFVIITHAIPLPKMTGSFLKIEIMKKGNSELGTTILGDKVVVPLSGTAPFGDNDGVEGELVPFSPLNACGKLQSSNYTQRLKSGNYIMSHNSILSTSIALIGPGGCSIDQKILNAQEVSGVAGVLIFLEKDEDLSKVSGKITESDINIPGFLISRTLGLNLLSKIEKYRTPGIDTDFDLPPASDKGVRQNVKMWQKKVNEDPWIQATIYFMSERATTKSIITMALLVICILLLAAFLGSLLMHFQTWRQQRRDAQRRELPHTDEIPNLPPIDNQFISNLPTVSYGTQTESKTDNQKGKAPIEDVMPINWANKSCPVCLDEFSVGEMLTELPCGHQYHTTCIVPWLVNRSPCCPLCKIDTRVGSANALLIQMGKSPVLPQQKIPGFFKYYIFNCWTMMKCCTNQNNSQQLFNNNN